MKKILIIEDEQAYITLLRDQLTREGYHVIEAQDGMKGLSLAKREHPDLILLDVRMPVMNGLTVLEELRKDSYGKTAKVIFLTNLEPDDQLLPQILENKPIYYLVKSDIQLDELLQKIKELFTLQQQ